MDTKWRDLVVIGLKFEEMLEWTFTRGGSLRERIEKVAYIRMKARSPGIDYENLDVRLHSIVCEDGDIEVVFDVRKI